MSRSDLIEHRMALIENMHKYINDSARAPAISITEYEKTANDDKAWLNTLQIFIEYVRETEMKKPQK